MTRFAPLAPVVALALLSSAADARRPGPTLDHTIAQVEAMPFTPEVTQLAARHGLSVVNVTWEDTGRYKGSSVGPNISDMTIGVRDGTGALHPMPVFRFDNFSDKTADVDVDEFIVPVGNAWGDDLRPTSLRDLLSDTRRYLHDPGSWSGRGRSLWAERDEHVLVSAQACFLPVPRAGEATFTPVLYNYQSSPDNPAVLTIVASRQGTSVQVIENEGGYLSEPLFFNADGERAPFTAARLSDVQSGRIDMGDGGPISAAGEDAANVVLVIQVPLKHDNAARFGMLGGLGYLEDMSVAEGMPAPMGARTRSSSDVENAVIGHGEAEGPYKELAGLEVERDERFPVRVTVQFYKATSNGVVSNADVAEIRRQIDRVYADGAWTGSLVTQGLTGRPTEWVQPQPQPQARWAQPNLGWHKAW